MLLDFRFALKRAQTELHRKGVVIITPVYVGILYAIHVRIIVACDSTNRIQDHTIRHGVSMWCVLCYLYRACFCIQFFL